MGLNQWADNRADEGQDTGDRPVPRHGRAALLRLAAWFEESGPDRADALATAAFALHPARHLEGRVDDSVAATTSWWQSEPDRSTVTEHPGTRLPEPVRDHRAQQARLRDAAESSAHWRRAGAEQVRSLLTEPTGDRARLDLSGAGMEVLMELLTAALGSGDATRRPTSAGDLEFGLRLHVHAAPGAEVTVRGEGGDLTLEGLRLCVTSYEQHTAPRPMAAPGVAARSALDSTRPVTAPPPAADPEPVSDPVADPEPVSDAGSVAGPGPVPDTAAGSTAPAAPASRTADADGGGSHAEPSSPRSEPPSSDEPGAPASPPPAGPPVSTADAPDAPDAPVADPAPTDSLPGPDPDVETTGPIDIAKHTPWTRRWG
ncbi:DUF2397 family protein [Nocardiopsis ganjiahuensis]|uniref:DUF2397 family protein n=1 Tax=Nocardiopsis ganjiahuensis TaxID=239984 RepID=UPI00034A7F0F|nr:DUF2397 family protein [Nocardiopsis ganjiahuensis]